MKKVRIWLYFIGQLLVTSCIYDAPKGDEFYRTLWTSFDPPLESVTLEFLCNGYVSIMGEGAVGSYGTYEAFDQTAYFSSLNLRYDDLDAIIIEEAHRTDDLLTICWHFAESEISFSSRLVRRSSYKDSQDTIK